ncbi:DNA polymerase IV [Halovivax cerinus]|uniref:DNA polymerase IV n=1 Tax=Halovivax cerinus TaxID=1487865 RepID=A0ABD5NSD1_9EURY|nr:DNA polymerase IV [Halovivax cerinus]
MADEARLPGVETESDEDPIVLHVDADCFYAACERLREPELRGEPVVVGMGYEPGDSVGAVATASYEAREFGVESAMAISQALENLPRRVDADSDSDLDVSETGVYRPVDMAYYESVSEDVRSILHESADVVREVSIDEAYLDVTERTDWSVAEGFARHVKERIAREVGVTVSIGVAPSMSAAKIASDFDKPDGLTVVEPDEVRSFLGPLDVDEIHGVGPVTARTLREMGLETAGDVADADPDALVEAFGERGRELYDYSRGADDRPVTPRGLPKSFSRESAFGSPVAAWERKRETLHTLAEAVADRATREGALYRTVGVKAVTPPYDVNTRERSLSGPVDDPGLVVEIATDLFREFDEDRVRKLGVKVANLEFDAANQSNLDGWGDATEPGNTNGAGSDGDGVDNPLDVSGGKPATDSSRTTPDPSPDDTGETSDAAGDTLPADQRTLDALVEGGTRSADRSPTSPSSRTAVVNAGDGSTDVVVPLSAFDGDGASVDAGPDRRDANRSAGTGPITSVRRHPDQTTLSEFVGN